jgi:hypothetical protein
VLPSIVDREKLYGPLNSASASDGTFASIRDSEPRDGAGEVKQGDGEREKDRE